jgi:predicted RNA-binding protein (virulence factor B family)
MASQKFAITGLSKKAAVPVVHLALFASIFPALGKHTFFDVACEKVDHVLGWPAPPFFQLSDKGNVLRQ